jgi:RNA polymerase sigma factor (sigma-70 family)
MRVTKLTGMPRGGSGELNSVERAVDNLQKIYDSFAEYCEVIRKDIEDSRRFKKAIDDIIETLEPRERQVIHLRYVNGKSFVNIGAMRIGCTDRNVQYIEASAVKKISEKIY